MAAPSSPQSVSPALRSPQSVSPALRSPQSVSPALHSPQSVSPALRSPQSVSPAPAPYSPSGKSQPTSQSAATNEEIQNLSKQLYLDDVNRAGNGDIILNLQHRASSSQTGTGTDFSSQKAPRSTGASSITRGSSGQPRKRWRAAAVADNRGSGGGRQRTTAAANTPSSQPVTPEDAEDRARQWNGDRLFGYVNEAKLFTRPTFARFISLLDNYVKNTGTLETVSNEEILEQTAFMNEVLQTTVMKKLSSFFISKGYYTSFESFESDLREMWFGLYMRSKGSLDSSGFEHVFHGEINISSTLKHNRNDTYRKNYKIMQMESLCPLSAVIFSNIRLIHQYAADHVLVHLKYADMAENYV
ncbi:unnamed protein product [Ranitomeya imitator]|uniref:Protein endoU n=1 Tax=Ranitomeya imitator TaxID=111125 RepID=A0ABN9M4Q8_9NEOB|nr:unnamed protein product [Ranitomeya imitator]